MPKKSGKPTKPKQAKRGRGSSFAAPRRINVAAMRACLERHNAVRDYVSLRRAAVVDLAELKAAAAKVESTRLALDAAMELGPYISKRAND